MYKNLEIRVVALICLGLAAFCVTLSMLMTSCSPSEAVSSAKPSATPLPSVVLAPKSCCERVWGTKTKLSHRAKTTGYFPDSSAMEGGFVTRFGDKLQTLQGFLAGKHSHVSVAIDKKLGRVKRKLCSDDLNLSFGKGLKLLVEDTGGAFTDKGFGRLDICVATRKDSLDKRVNGTITYDECE